MRLRSWALPLALVCAMAYVGSVLHFALVRHVACLEHGEMVHVDDASGLAMATPEDSFDDARVASRPEQASVGHGADAHCAHAFFRREVLPPAEGTLLMAAAPARSAPALAVFRFHAEPVARLHLAPKASPPRA